jgi:hypothetical protein
MATPHTPIAILLLHLQATCDVIILTFVIAMGLFPAGVAGIAVTLLRLVRKVGEGVKTLTDERALVEEEAPLLH